MGLGRVGFGLGWEGFWVWVWGFCGCGFGVWVGQVGLGVCRVACFCLVGYVGAWGIGPWDWGGCFRLGDFGFGLTGWLDMPGHKN